MKKYYFIALLLIPILAMGCGSSTTGPSASAGGDTAVKSANLTVNAKFPSGAKAGEVGAALIDTNTKSMMVDIYTNTGYDTVILNAASPSYTFTSLIPGEIGVHIYTFDYDRSTCDPNSYPYPNCGNQLDHLQVGGAITEGQNNLVATLIRGKWDFVNASNVPTTMIVNSTYLASPETMTGFSVVPGYMPGGVSVDPNKLLDLNEYSILWKGANIGYLNGASYFGFEAYPGTFMGSPLAYATQFIGPSTNNTSIQNGDVDLTPNPNFPGTIQYLDPMNPMNGAKSNRFMFLFGLPFGFDYNPGYGYGGGGGPDTFAFSNGTDAIPSFNQWATTAVVDSTTISGIGVEVLVKSMVSNSACLDTYNYLGMGYGAVFNCPMGFNPAPKVKVDSKAIMKAVSGKVSKVIVPDNNGCYYDVTFTSASSYQACGWDINGDGYYTECFQANRNESGLVTACKHNFKAKGTQLPSTDLNVIIQ